MGLERSSLFQFSSFQENLVFSAHFLTVAVDCASFFGHGEKWKNCKKAKFCSNPVYTNPVRNFPNSDGESTTDLGVGGGKMILIIQCPTPWDGVALEFTSPNPAPKSIGLQKPRLSVTESRIARFWGSDFDPHPQPQDPCFSSATRSRTEILTKENFVGAKTAPIAVSRTFAPLVRRTRFP